MQQGVVCARNGRTVEADESKQIGVSEMLCKAMTKWRRKIQDVNSLYLVEQRGC